MLNNVKEKNEILYRVADNFPEDGVRFIDLTPSLIRTNYRLNILSKMVNHIENELGDIDAVVSPDARGFIWGAAVATLMNKPFIPVRKTGKLSAECIQGTVSYDTEYSTTSLDLPKLDARGLRVIFVDDVYATGGTYSACKKLIEDAGGTLVGCTVVYDVGIDNNDDVWSLSRGDL
jgi:adenine phosphoribosyltransferase